MSSSKTITAAETANKCDAYTLKPQELTGWVQTNKQSKISKHTVNKQ